MFSFFKKGAHVVGNVLPSYHLPGLVDDLAGKSSRTRWVEAHDLRQDGEHVSQLVDVRRVDLAGVSESIADFVSSSLCNVWVLAEQIASEYHDSGGRVCSGEEEHEGVSFVLFLREGIVVFVLEEVVEDVCPVFDVAACLSFLGELCDVVV